MTHHTSSISGRRIALTDEAIRDLAPSVFATSKAPSTSSRYTHISTAAVMGDLRKAGFVPVDAKQGRAMTDDGREYMKHLLRFQLAEYVGSAAAVGEVTPEAVLVNAHDRTSGFQLYGGVFRFICGNGMIVADSLIAAIRIRHVGDVSQKVLDATQTIMEGTHKVLAVRDRWAKVLLSMGEQADFAKAAMALRYPDEEKQPFDFRKLLQAHRSEDASADLWHTFNTVQENLMRGGIRGVSTTGSGRRTRSRAISAIQPELEVNRGLWALADKLAA